ncbi:hypothetical protein CHS0354_021599 [Potamilus streckersoni]|uniref:VWFA domain-containing protein n=1 Tax=Potamilus streckersoni TaxID=2493646 RepID=A0AAE0W076_9BIVA|nr:hypothetical protein CHS0354_021599 [Potamilus streckersoni]
MIQSERVIAVGIGSSVSITELRHIASDNAHVFTVPSFSSLSSIISQVQATVYRGGIHFFFASLPSPLPPPKKNRDERAIKTCQHQCDNQVADVVILLDASSSVGSGSFQKQLDFVHNLTNKLTIGQDNVLISVVTTSEVPYSKFYLNSFIYKQDVLHAIRNITYDQGTTNTGAALKYIRENSFLEMNGGRDNAAKLVIVLTDANFQYPTNTAEEAKLLHGSDVKVSN